MATESDSYCAEADVIARVQFLADFDGSSTPTEAQLLEFMANRAAELYAMLADTMGASAYGPASYTTNLSSPSNDSETALLQLLKHFNSLGAAIDVMDALGATEDPARSEKVAEWAAEYATAMDRITPLAKIANSSASSRSFTHISKGEITQKSVTSREEDGLVVTDQTKF